MNDRQDDVRRTKLASEQRQERTDLCFLIRSAIEDIHIFGYRMPVLGIFVPTNKLAGAHAYSSNWGLSSPLIRENRSCLNPHVVARARVHAKVHARYNMDALVGMRKLGTMGDSNVALQRAFPNQSNRLF